MKENQEEKMTEYNSEAYLKKLDNGGEQQLILEQE